LKSQQEITMSAETRKVLEMLAAGKITSDDAERLLDKLASTNPELEGTNKATAAYVLEPGSTAGPKAQPTAAKFLRVLIDSGEGHDVNVRIPLVFLRSGVRFFGMLPPKVAEKLNNKGINFDFLSSLRGEELNEALNALHVDIDTDEGQHVRVFCE
jgi:hypothetical protein